MKIMPKGKGKGGISIYRKSHAKWNKAEIMPFFQAIKRGENFREVKEKKMDFWCLHVTVGWDLSLL